ncbi:ROK family protein [Motiliproteus sp. MSK22-1]|uniref:ROK family protein n=1 Tax=Motiliproteus sp. MSK22-1 TaxID=1897630 RepID=UPI00097837EE|nr:ROK family protein [Motiliproteus sp. MSK22-1]OMH25784.1 hypothetical protein BGP75_24995 [Motiliproteus sp. MSK22-1]
MAVKATNSGSTSEQARQYNERIILQYVRQSGEIARAKLAKLTALSAQTISVITSSLIERELLQVVGREYGGRGQPSIKLALNPRGAYSIGINLDRDHISISLVDFSGKLLQKFHHELLYPTPEQALNRVSKDLTNIQTQLGLDWSRVRGVGLAMPRKMGSWLDELGFGGNSVNDSLETGDDQKQIQEHLGQDFTHRENEAADNIVSRLNQWNEVDFGQQLHALFDLPVMTENDAGAAALGELFYGLGHRYSHFFYLFIGMSLGGGIISEGQYFRGANGNAADFGLFPVANEHGQPSCMLMSKVSLASLYRYLQKRNIVVDSPEQLQHLKGSDDESIVDAWVQQAAQALVVPLFSVMATLDTQALIFGGRLPPYIMEKLIRATQDLSSQWLFPEQVIAEYVQSETGMDAAVVGAAMLPLHENYSPMRERLLVRSANTAL